MIIQPTPTPEKEPAEPEEEKKKPAEPGKKRRGRPRKGEKAAAEKKKAEEEEEGEKMDWLKPGQEWMWCWKCTEGRYVTVACYYCSFGKKDCMKCDADPAGAISRHIRGIE
jgi:hypothetical protein